MHEVTSILNAARELGPAIIKNETYACCVGSEVISIPKKKTFSNENDIVPDLMFDE